MTDSQTAFQQSLDRLEAGPIDIMPIDIDSDETSIERMKPYTLDDYYIESYLEDPRNKSQAYVKACDMVGKVVPEQYVPQYAHILHSRLLDRINERLSQLTIDDKAYGRAVTRELAEKAKSEQVRAQTAKTLTGSHYSGNESGSQAIHIEVNREGVSIKSGNQSVHVDSDAISGEKVIESES